jgi:small subunit ribosomal protein S4
MGLSKSRSGARQLVSHEHIVVNGKVCNISSRLIKPGEIVGVREKSKSLSVIEESIALNDSVYEWITWDNNKLEGVFNSVPNRDQIPENIKEQLIVELYSK